MSRSIKTLSRALLLSGALLCAVSVVAAAPASAAQVPCWKKLLNDWYDGAISSIYPLPCYNQAIDHLPADVAVYSSAKDDILNARAAAARHQAAPPEQSTSTTPLTTTNDASPPRKKGGFSGLVADITPGGPQAFPLPLLILGALAILLVAAGAAGMIWRRTQGREPGTP